jgi:septum formation inhibitor MinC
MRDETVYGLTGQLNDKINQVVQFIQNLQQAIRLDSTGKEIRLLAIQQLLIKKGIITEAEMTEQSGEVIKQMQAEAEAQAAKAKAPEIVPATPAQTAQVEATKTEAPAPVVPPQA